MTGSPRYGPPKKGPPKDDPPEAGPTEPGILIQTLAERPEAVPLLAVWFRQEWRTHFGRYAQAEVEAEIREGMQRDALPLTLVALSLPGAASTPPSDDTAEFCGTAFCGTATLRAESFGELDDVGEEFEELGDIRGEIRGPWLGGLYIVPERRGRGIALALLDRARAEARALGHAHLYAGTATAGPLFERAGWTALHQLAWHGALVTIYGTALE